MTLYDSGIRPVIDAHLAKLAEEKRDYGEYWSASSAGYCYRRLIFERLQIPYVTEDARKQRVFSSGHVFHEWIQKITKDAGLSIAQELELQDEELMIRGHVDDLVLIDTRPEAWKTAEAQDEEGLGTEVLSPPKLILYDYKTAHSKWFEYAKSRPVSYFNRLQVATYMYMVRRFESDAPKNSLRDKYNINELSEARILRISKDDLRLHEYQVLWSDELRKEVRGYWVELNAWWKTYESDGFLPDCSCHEHENGFLAKEKWNPYWYEDEPCSEAWFELKMKERVAP